MKMIDSILDFRFPALEFSLYWVPDFSFSGPMKW